MSDFKIVFRFCVFFVELAGLIIILYVYCCKGGPSWPLNGLSRYSVFSQLVWEEWARSAHIDSSLVAICSDEFNFIEFNFIWVNNHISLTGFVDEHIHAFLAMGFFIIIPRFPFFSFDPLSLHFPLTWPINFVCLSIGPPFLGAPKALRAVIGGDCMGLEVMRSFVSACQNCNLNKTERERKR